MLKRIRSNWPEYLYPPLQHMHAHTHTHTHTHIMQKVRKPASVWGVNELMSEFMRGKESNKATNKKTQTNTNKHKQENTNTNKQTQTPTQQSQSPCCTLHYSQYFNICHSCPVQLIVFFCFTKFAFQYFFHPIHSYFLCTYCRDFVRSTVNTSETEPDTLFSTVRVLFFLQGVQFWLENLL